MFSPEIRRRLSEISRGKRSTERPALRPAAAPEYVPAFELSGREERNELGPYFVYEYRMSSLIDDAPRIVEQVRSRAGALLTDPSRFLFVDLETCGLSNVPVFLVGTMRMDDGDFVIRQLFARDYSEERNVLFAMHELVTAVEGVVTFNGKAFDIPFLRDRATFHRLEFAEPRVHHDLIVNARRMWRRTLPDCRLQTIESTICGRYRSGDVPGCRIPALYHEFVKTGDMDPLVPVFKHNVMDLMTMAELLPRLF